MDAFIGEIRAYPYSFVPAGWMECKGQALSIKQYAALHAVIGTAFGGDGTTTFNLPDLRGTAAIGAGTDAQGNSYRVGTPVGSSTVAVTQAQMPQHSHALQSQSAPPLTATPGPSVIPTDPQYTAGGGAVGYLGYTAQPSSTAPMATEMLASTGQGQPHDNHSPYLVLRWCIAVDSSDFVYPMRPG